MPVVPAQALAEPVHANSLVRTRAYLDQLPSGLRSFPRCLAKASVVRSVYAFSEQPIVGLPAALQQLLDVPPPSSSWIPQCHALALIVAMIEARRLEGEGEGAWVRAAATHLFASPMYKILMWAATPNLVFRTASVRWAAFFRGTALRSEVAEATARLSLEAPAKLFHRDLAEIFVHVIDAAVNYTKDGAAAATIELAQFGGGRHVYTGRW